MFLGFYVLNGVLWWIHRCTWGAYASPLDDRWRVQLESDGTYSVVPVAPGVPHSILCRNCGCHGYITNGEWQAV